MKQYTSAVDLALKYNKVELAVEVSETPSIGRRIQELEKELSRGLAGIRKGERRHDARDRRTDRRSLCAMS
jgi:hypothetical protein